MPFIVAPLVTLLGLACTAAVVTSFRAANAAPVASSAPPSLPVAPPPPTAPVAPIAPPAPVASPVAAPPEPVVAPAAPSACPPLYVNFERSSAHLPSAAPAALATFGAWLAAHPSAHVTLDGHADSRGNEHSNLRLSRDRATAVANALVAAGAQRSQLTARGFGSFLPFEAEAEDAAINRRVVVHTKGEACPREKEETIER